MRSRASLAIGAQATLGDVEEFAAQMRPAEGERDRLVASRAGNVLVGRISIALHDAAVVIEQLECMDGAAARGVAVGYSGRIGAAPGPVIAGDGPEVSFLCLSATGIEHRDYGFIDRDLARRENEFAQAKINRLELGRRIAHPERQDRALDAEALNEQHLGLPIERQMPCVLATRT